MQLDLMQLGLAAVLGGAAGLVGGLAGIGGSLLMIPGLGVIIGYSDDTAREQHLYAAAAMLVNLIVAITSTRQHVRKGAVRRDVLRVLIPALGVSLVAGVLLSNAFQGRTLALGLAAFISVYAVQSLYLAVRHRKAPAPDPAVDRVAPAKPAPIAAVGTVAGLAGGLLGLGGGAIMVPGLQTLARLPLRTAIAGSAAAMCATSGVGAVLKIGTLGQHGLLWTDAIWLAAAMGAPAMLLAPQGAKLAHGLPIHWVRAVIGVVLLGAAARLAGLV